MNDVNLSAFSLLRHCLRENVLEKGVRSRRLANGFLSLSLSFPTSCYLFLPFSIWYLSTRTRTHYPTQHSERES